MPASTSRPDEGPGVAWQTFVHRLACAGRDARDLNDALLAAVALGREHLPCADASAFRVRALHGDIVDCTRLADGPRPSELRAFARTAGAGRAALDARIVIEPDGELCRVHLPVSRRGRTEAVVTFEGVAGNGLAAGFDVLLETVQLTLGFIADRGDGRPALSDDSDPDREFLHALMENLPAALVVYDAAELRVIGINAHAEREFGLRRDAVHGKTVAEAFGRTVADLGAEAMRQALAEPVTIDTDFEVGKGAKRRFVNVRHVALRNADGRPRWLIALSRDITNERTAERDLQESERRFREFTESMDDVLFVTNPDRTHFHFLSTPRSDGWGNTREGLASGSKDFLRKMHKDDVVLMRQRRDAERRLEPTDISYRAEHPVRGLRWIRSRTRSRLMPDGEVRVYGLVSDVTDERLRQDELKAARDAAESASQAKSQFMANMSHEIRTPMNGILGMTELLLGTTLSDKQRRFVQAVYRSGESLLEIINDILDFSKIEAGRLDLAHVDFSVRAVVEDTLELLAPRAHEKGLELSFREAPDFPPVLRGDPLRLRQVLTNLVANAIKFTEQGEVAVEVRMDGQTPQPRFEFTVRDTGIGIEADTLPRLFSAFMQGSVGMSRRYGGTGLGLTISKQLVELMGGTIEAHSQPGQGSQFVFLLPFEIADVDGEASNDELATMPALRVLVVDDLETNRVVLDNLLRAWGMQVVMAVDGREALDLLTAGGDPPLPFDVALVDMHMPRMDGFDLARALKAAPPDHAPKMILLSSASTQDDVRTAHELGFERFVAKPVRKAELRQAILGVASKRLGQPRLTTRLSANILVVEDNVVNQEVIGQMLRGLGCRVHMSSSGLAGLRALCEKRFDLILMDIQMPGMDGVESLSWFRQGKTRRFLFVTPVSTPVIAVTANALEGDEERFLGLGFDGYLSKPFRQSQLLAMLTQHLRPPAPGDAPPGAPADAATGLPTASERSPAPVGGDVLDQQALDRLRELDPTGENRLMERVVGAFETSVARLMPQLSEAMQTTELAGIRHVSHTLKSSSASMGAVKLSKMCSEIESMARQGQTDGLADRVAQLQTEVDVVRAALKRMLDA